ncbi:MAG: hypothetical protein ACOYLO_00520 [Ferruginibacter sp.]
MESKEIIDILYKKFDNAIEVSINDEILDLCKKFASAVNPTTRYDDCGQNDMDKRYIDNLIGKISEFAVYGILNSIGKENNFEVNRPDINIYKGKKKSWKSDLSIIATDNEINMAVKSQTLSQALKYSFSGTFQAASFRRDAALDNSNEIIFLCLVDDSSDYKKTLVLPPKKISDIKMSDPKLPKFRGIKICYYAKENFEQEVIVDWLNKFGVKKLDKIL